MIMFEGYRNRLGYYGTTNREAIATQSRMAKEVCFEDSQSYKSVIIRGRNVDARITQDVADTVKTGNGNYKIEFREDERFYIGEYVMIQNVYGDYEHWMLMDMLDDVFNQQFLIKKCTYHLFWMRRDKTIIDRWVAFDDSYKLYNSSRNYDNTTSLPESSIVIYMPYDNDTAALRRDDRFLIDVPNHSETPDAYSVVNRDAVSRLYGNHGIVRLSLKSDQFNFKTDNAKLMIANYYGNALDTDTINDGISIEDKISVSAERAEINYKGQNRIVMGTPYKEFTALFFDAHNHIVEDIICEWQLKMLPEFEEYFAYEINDNKIKIKTQSKSELTNYQFKLVATATNINTDLKAEITVKVVSGI